MGFIAGLSASIQKIGFAYDSLGGGVRQKMLRWTHANQLTD